MFDRAREIVQQADILLVVGTSLAVYPAASLVHYAAPDVPVYVVDPGVPDITRIRNKVYHIKENSANGLPILVDRLIEEYK